MPPLANAMRPAWAYTPEFLHFRLIEELDRARRGNTALAIVVIQLRGPDQTEGAISEILRWVVRLGDIAVITGKYEVAVCLLDVDRQAAQAVGERLLSSLGDVGVSVGVAVYPVDPLDDPVDLVDLARKRSSVSVEDGEDQAEADDRKKRR